MVKRRRNASSGPTKGSPTNGADKTAGKGPSDADETATDLGIARGIFSARSRALDLQIKSKSEASLLEFMRHAWRVVDPATPFVTGWPLEAICEHLEAVTHGYIKRLIINVPPGSTKSTSVYMWSAWEWGPQSLPSNRIIKASYSDDLAERDILRCKTVVESPWYKKLWGDRFGPHPSLNSKRKFGNSAQGWLLATSPEGIGLGERGDRFVLDDPNNIDTDSPTVRSKIKIWFTEVVPSRLNDLEKSAIVLIQQRLHEEDCTGIALEKEMGFTHLMIPLEYDPKRTWYVNAFVGDEETDELSIKSVYGSNAVAVPQADVFYKDPRTEPGENAWPARFPPREVERIKREQGPIAFAGMYQQSPVARGGNIIGRDAFKLYDHPTYPNFSSIVMGVDTSLTAKAMSNNDPSALVVIGKTQETVLDGDVAVYGPKFIILYAWAGYKSFDELAKFIYGVATCSREILPDIPVRFDCDRVLIEDSAAARPVSIELERQYRVQDKFTVDLVKTGREDKVARLQSVESFFRQGMIWTPNKRWADELMDEVAVFPNGSHDDRVDALSMTLRWFRNQGLLETKDEQQFGITELTRFRPRRPPPLYPA
jgi:hypothetical protein